MSQQLAGPPVLESALIRKYDSEGPWYNSYPTAIRFQPAFDVQRYLQTLQQQCPSVAPLSLYTHIPFGAYDFHYCTTTREVVKDERKAHAYLHHLAIEFELQGALFGAQRRVTQLQWGGGMAPYLTAAEMTELMHRTASHFNLVDSPGRDYCIDIDLLTTDKEKLALLKGLGFNHIRVAIQICRQSPQQIEDLRTLCDMVRDYAFDTLSFDLSFADRDQSVDAFQQALWQIIDLQPDRMTLRDSGQVTATSISLGDKFCSAGRHMSLRIMACQTFVARGYILIGMQHFARPNDALREVQKAGELRRNLQGYCAAFVDDLVGVGVSALSGVGDFYIQNECCADAYSRRLNNRELPIACGFHLNEEEQLRRYAIMQITCNLRLDFATLLQRFDIVFAQYFSSVLPKLNQMSADGLLRISNDELRVTDAGKPLLRNICMLFDTCSAPPRELVQSQMY